MANVLDQIVAHKLTEIAAAKSRRPIAEIKSALIDAATPRNFVAALKTHHPMGLIAEVKRASPSAGMIRESFDPVEIARIYESHGAACISVLTDEHFFQGRLSYLTEIRQNTLIPVLRKDFILDPYQIYEARAAGADAVLLIAECLSDQQLQELYAVTLELGMQALVEVYERENVARALKLAPDFLGVNNRNLQTFETRLEHTIDLRQDIPNEILLVGESGIHSREDVRKLQSAGVHAMLVGESLMRAPDIGRRVRELLGN